MSVKRKSIKLLDHERRLLVQLYVRWKIPIDQFSTRAHDLEAFVAEWNKLASRADSEDEVLHFMMTQRKRSLWVRLDSGCLEVPPTEPLTAEESEALVAVYEANVVSKHIGSDALAYDLELADKLAEEFTKLTGRILPASVLVTKITALRKRGLLPKVEDQPKPADSGFDDLDQAAS